MVRRVEAPYGRNEISFMGANFVARQLDWTMTEGWGQGDQATNDWFAPAATFERRFAEMLDEVVALGFMSFDVWTAQLNWTWATPSHLTTARRLLDERGLTVPSYAGGFGGTVDEFARACAVAEAIGTGILGGGVKTALLKGHRDALVDRLVAADLRLALENHPERTPAEMLAKVGDGAGGRIGTAVDTGWYGTQGFDAAEAIRELGDHVMHVHLKDVSAVGAHDCCRYGEGVVPVRDCVAAIREIGYTGAVAVEHEPETYDPSAECAAHRELLAAWLAEPEPVGTAR